MGGGGEGREVILGRHIKWSGLIYLVVREGGGGIIRRLRLLLLVPLLAVPPGILLSPHARGLVVRRLTSCFMIRVCPWRPGGARRCAASGSRSGGRPLRCCGGWRVGGGSRPPLPLGSARVPEVAS